MPNWLNPWPAPKASPKSPDFSAWKASTTCESGLLVPAAIVFSGFSAKLRSLAFKIGRRWYLAVGLFGVLYLVVAELVTFPLSYYLGYIRPHEYDLSVQTFPAWLIDEVKSLGVNCVLIFVGLGLPYLALKHLPRAWPWAVAAGYVPIAFVLMFLSPIVIDPLFHSFGPMKDQAMETEILALADRAGIDGGRIFEVDMSRETTTVNAYVKGFGESKRIVLWDTLLAKLDRREVLFVMGHEMGHYVLGHVVRTLLLGTFGVLAACLFVQFTGNWLVRRFRERFGFHDLGDVASFPLLILLGSVFMFAFSPVGMAYSRYQEHEADRFALELTRDNHAGATAFAKLQKENLGNPRPGQLMVLWRFTHPPLGERIDFCNDYRPWDSKVPLSYEMLFRR